jgi:thiol-disulfide isomerase/thioredoxin
MSITAWGLAIVLLTPSQSAVYTGTLNEKPIADGQRTGGDFSLTVRPDLPDHRAGDRALVFRAWHFKSAAAKNGFEVVLRQRGDVMQMFADDDLDGKVTLVAELRDTTNVTGWDQVWQLPSGSGGLVLPVQSRITVRRSGADATWTFFYTWSYRVEGHVDVNGRKTLVTLPFKPATGTIDVTDGYIGIDSDGDGKIAGGDFSSELLGADGKPVVMRLGDRFVSIESADLKARTFTMKERAASEYTVIEVRAGTPLQDFSFTDYEGKLRKLSEFRGKHVLLDIWGSWCGPCVADVPDMKAAYERFRERGFEIVGLDYELSKSADQVRPFLEEKGVRWVNGTPESVKNLVHERLRISAFPTLILLDPQGVVIQTQPGQLRGKRLLETLEKIFEK